MGADELRQAAATLRERANSVRRPFAQQERIDVALADWLDEEANDFETQWVAEGYEMGERWGGLLLARLINGGAS